MSTLVTGNRPAYMTEAESKVRALNLRAWLSPEYRDDRLRHWAGVPVELRARFIRGLKLNLVGILTGKLPHLDWDWALIELGLVWDSLEPRP